MFGVTTETKAIRARVGDLHLEASTDRKGAERPRALARSSRQPPRGGWPQDPGTARAAPPSLLRSCRGHQPWEVETPPARSCAPAGSEGVAGGAWDAPSPQSVPKLRSLALETSTETVGLHSEWEATDPSLRPSRRGLLPPRTPSAPASAMAPGMLGRHGAALLCLSALLAHGKCRGADSG